MPGWILCERTCLCTQCVGCTCVFHVHMFCAHACMCVHVDGVHALGPALLPGLWAKDPVCYGALFLDPAQALDPTSDLILSSQPGEQAVVVPPQPLTLQAGHRCSDPRLGLLRVQQAPHGTCASGRRGLCCRRLPRRKPHRLQPGQGSSTSLLLRGVAHAPRSSQHLEKEACCCSGGAILAPSPRLTWVRGSEVGTKTCRNVQKRSWREAASRWADPVWLQGSWLLRAWLFSRHSVAPPSCGCLCPPLPALSSLVQNCGAQGLGHSCTLCSPECAGNGRAPAAALPGRHHGVQQGLAASPGLDPATQGPVASLMGRVLVLSR